MRLRVLFLASLLTSFAAAMAAVAQQDPPMATPQERAALHEGSEWLNIQAHLPDPQTASPAKLETAGDVLQARRFPDDALDYYGYALARGGDVSSILNKMGVLHLELRQNQLAHQLFLRTVRAKKNDAQGWNNLGVSEYALHNYRKSVADYKRASRLDGRSAVYHSNLSMAYFELDDVESGRQQLTLALQLDPSIMQRRETGGSTAHLLGSKNYPELCFEMAKILVRTGQIQQMRMWLARASEGGFDVKDGMAADSHLQPYLKDAQVKVMLSNTEQMLRKRSVAAVSAPGLGNDATRIVNMD